MTTPAAVNTALACEVDAIGFVFATSVRKVTTQRASELAAPARNRVACVAVTRHPTREQIEEILRDFRPDILQTDIEDIGALDLPQTLSVLPVMRPGLDRRLCVARPRVVRRAGERHAARLPTGKWPPNWRAAASSSSPAG